MWMLSTFQYVTFTVPLYCSVVLEGGYYFDRQDTVGLTLIKLHLCGVIPVRSVQCVIVGHLKTRILNALYFMVLVLIPIGYDPHMN